jgi:phosphoglycolate phosphatase-like HAD superfamily hydrolase
MKYIIFDFDGTLADSMPVIVSIAEEMLGVDITDKDIQRYRNMTAKQILKEARVPLYRLPALLVKGKAIMAGRVDDVRLFDGLEAVVKKLAEDHVMYVVSSNGIGIITAFLKRHKINKYFTRVYGNVGLFSKAQAIRKVTKREGFNVGDAIYIGDEVRDIEAARKIGMPIISVTWGYNGEQIIKKYMPDHLVTKPAQIVGVIKNA